MRNVNIKASHAKGRDVVGAIFDCLAVSNRAEYRQLAETHVQEAAAIQADEMLETEDRLLLSDTHFVHDRCSMVIFRVRDDHNYPVTDFDLLLTGGKDNDPNKLPKGFFMDRQRNRVSSNTVTYFFNYDIMAGAPEVKKGDEVIRAATQGAEALGIKILPRPSNGFVHYLNCEIQASKELLNEVLRPNCTTMIDIQLRRVVRKNVFRMTRMTGDATTGSFRKTRPGDDFVS